MEWEQLAGDERVRFCAVCEKQVYNIAEMTRGEVEGLVRRTEGKFCAQLFHRGDGTVVTKDCGQWRGLRAGWMARAAGVGLSWWMSWGFAGAQEKRTSEGLVQVEAARGAVAGQVVDPAGAVIPGARVELRRDDDGQLWVDQTGDGGMYRAVGLEPGKYDLRVSAQSFKAERLRLEIKPGARVDLNVELQVGAVGEVVEVTPSPRIVRWWRKLR